MSSGMFHEIGGNLMEGRVVDLSAGDRRSPPKDKRRQLCLTSRERTQIMVDDVFDRPAEEGEEVKKNLQIHPIHARLSIISGDETSASDPADILSLWEEEGLDFEK